MDIYAYLKKDHRKVADLMDQVLATENPSERQQLFQQIRMELTLHAESEEKTFYAAIEKATKAQLPSHEMEHAHGEHDEMREYLEKLAATPTEDPSWIELFGEFKHCVTHHVEEEEEDIFEQAKKYLEDDQAKQLAKDMDALKKDAMARQSETV